MSEYATEINRLRELLAESNYTVFFGGAGVSTESGIPDFRGTGGLYSSSEEKKEYYLSRACLLNEPDKFYRFYRENMIYHDVIPNSAHYALAELERRGKVFAVITQNIDGLHQMAGSGRVIELHGTSEAYYCISCGEDCPKEEVLGCDGVPTCRHCGGLIRPDVTLYGERLSKSAFSQAEREIEKADLLIVGGTSLSVYPAAGLVEGFEGKLVIINYTPTPLDDEADIVIRESISQVFEALL